MFQWAFENAGEMVPNGDLTWFNYIYLITVTMIVIASKVWTPAASKFRSSAGPWEVNIPRAQMDPTVTKFYPTLLQWPKISETIVTIVTRDL